MKESTELWDGLMASVGASFGASTSPADVPPDRDEKLSDLYVFAKEVLGYEDMQEQPHRELCEFVTAPERRRKLILMPRGSFKSSVVTIGYSLWRMVHDSNARILIDSETFSNSKRFLGEIRGHIERNEVFRKYCGVLDARRDDTSWTQSEITVSTRTQNLKEPTISTAGVDVVKVGMHYDLIIMDDVVSQMNIGTSEMIEKMIDHYRLILSILEPDGELVVIGTRWHDRDLYGHLVENEFGFDFYIRKAILDDGSLLFPERLTRDFLESQRAAQGSYIFSCQYLNSPIDDKDAVFRREWFQFYDQPPEGLTVTATVDPAISDREGSDYSAIVVVGTNRENSWYILEAIRGRWNLLELVERIFEIHRRWLPIKIGIETVGFQRYISQYLAEQMRQRDAWLPITELKTDTRKSKEMRIRGLQPRFETRTVFLRRGVVDLEDELLRFPRGRHDDLVDALAYHLQLTSGGQRGLEFDTTVHVINPTGNPPKHPKISDDWKRYRSIHFAPTGPFCCIWLAAKNADDVLVYDEVFNREGALEDFLSMVRAKSRGRTFEWSMRSHEVENIKHELHSREIYTLKPLKKHSPEQGMSLIRRLLKVKRDGKPSLMVFSDCGEMVRELAGGVSAGTSKEESFCLKCLSQWVTKWDLEMQSGSIFSRYY